jgi:hypothetical protein
MTTTRKSPRATCLLCGDTIQSYHRHDFKWCSCKNIFVDGGTDYFRFGYNSDKYTIEYPQQEEEEDDEDSSSG